MVDSLLHELLLYFLRVVVKKNLNKDEQFNEKNYLHGKTTILDKRKTSKWSGPDKYFAFFNTILPIQKLQIPMKANRYPLKGVIQLFFAFISCGTVA